MRPERRLPGCLGALLFALPAAPIAWQLTRSGVFLGLAALTGLLLSAAGYRLFAGRSSGFGLALAAVFSLLAALCGLWWGYAELILRENEAFGCTMSEALALVPTVASDPGNRVQLLWDLGSLAGLDLLGLWAAARWRQMAQ